MKIRNIRTQAQMRIVEDVTRDLILAKVKAGDTAKLAAMLPRLCTNNHVGAARRAVRTSMYMTIAKELERRGMY